MFSFFKNISNWFYSNKSTIPSRKYGWIKGKLESNLPNIKITNEHVKIYCSSNNISQETTKFDLRKILDIPEALSEMDQGELGSCVANSTAFAYACEEIKQKNREVFLPARLFIYYNGRLIEGKINEDSGLEIKDGIKAIATYGVVDEHRYIYDPLKFMDKPPEYIYNEAKKSYAIKYALVDLTEDSKIIDRIMHLKRTLMTGFPIVFGFTVYESFESEDVMKTGMMPIPQPDEKILGGHSVCAVGFDDELNCFIVKNSWGKKWGLNGYFYMPYDFIGNSNLASDFWIITSITNPINIEGFQSCDIYPDAVNLDKKYWSINDRKWTNWPTSDKKWQDWPVNEDQNTRL